MINLSRRGMLGVAALLSVLVVLILALSVNALMPLGSAAPLDVPPQATATVISMASNLLSNDSFEKNPNITETSWSADKIESDISAIWSDTAARTGKYSLSLSTTTFRQGGWPGWFTINPIKIEGGKKYMFSVWVFSPNKASAWVAVNMYDANGQFLVGYSTRCSPIQKTNTWQLMQLTVPVSDRDASAAPASQVKLGLQQCSSSESDTGKTLFFDNVFFGTASPDS
jgi:hypothetical protein